MLSLLLSKSWYLLGTPPIYPGPNHHGHSLSHNSIADAWDLFHNKFCSKLLFVDLVVFEEF